MEVKSKYNMSICAFCHSSVDTKAAVICPACHRPYHRECWIGNDNHCAILGCTGQKRLLGSSASVRNGIHPQLSVAVIAVIAVVFFIAGLAGGIGIVVINFPPNKPIPSTQKPQPIFTETPITTITQENTPTLTPAPTSTSTPPPSFSIQEFNSWKGNDPVCPTCSIEGWTDQTKSPGYYNWDVDFSFGDPASIYLGWCAVDKTTLDQNFQYMKYELKIDGYPIDLDNLTFEEEEKSDRVCYGYAGVLTNWSKGEHSYIWIHHVQQDINDGWDPYAAGDYIFEFTVNVK